MKALSFPPFRIAFAWLWGVILMAGLQSAKGCITDCVKPIMLAEVKFKDHPHLPGATLFPASGIGGEMKCEIEVHGEFIV